MPILLNKPVKMYKASIVTSRTIIDDLLKTLQEHGVIHVIERREKVQEYLSLAETARKVNDMINYILSHARGRVIDVKITVNEIMGMDIGDIAKDVESIYNELRALEKTLSDLQRLKSIAESLRRVLEPLPQSLQARMLHYSGRHVLTELMIGSKDSFTKLVEKLKPIIIIAEARLGEETIALITCPTTLKERLYEQLRLLNIRTVSVPEKYLKLNTIKDVVNSLNKEISELSSRINEVHRKINELIENTLHDVVKYKIILDNQYSKLVALVNSIPSKYLTIIEGWVPRTKLDELGSIAKKHPVYVDLKEPAPDEEPPTLLSNPRIIRYFEPIVKFLGIPNYREWDPTPIIAYSFAIFYGLMLGDIAYGIAIILAALFVLDKLAGPSAENPDYKLFKKALIVSSIVGILVGIFGGYFFGDIFDRIGLKSVFVNMFGPLSMIFNDPLLFLEASLIIGLIHVNLAHAIALVKALRDRRIGDILIEIGLFITQVFGIPYIIMTILRTPIPWLEGMKNILVYGALSGVALIIAGTFKNIGGLGVFMWLFHITGLLGDVLSYSRIAGVGLATVYLATSFNTMASMVFSSVKPINVALGLLLALAVGIIGHIVNTALSALGAFIHSLRLCFVEFLTKFYEGTGYPFEPLRIVIKRKYVIE